jgi:hypothetical protein
MKSCTIAWITGTIVLCAWLAPANVSAQTSLEKLEKAIRKQLKLPEGANQSAPETPADRAADGENPDKPANPGKPEKPAAEAVQDRGYLGAVVDDRKDRGRGVRVERVIPGGPADRAGLRVGDLVTGLGGIRVRQMSDFAAIVEQVAPGNSLTFELLRGENREKIDVVFGPRTGSKKPAQAGSPKAPDENRRMGAPVPRPPAPSPETAPGAGSGKLSLEPPVAPNPRTGAKDDGSRMQLLERRMELLERRLEELERAIKAQQAK